MSVRSLYRRALRATAYCADGQRDWTASYVRMRFRESAPGQRKIAEEEEELAGFVAKLLGTGRLQPVEARRLQPGAPPPPPPPPPPPREQQPAPAARAWDEDDVGAWLRERGLEQHVQTFARNRVDGRVLLSLDDADLADELGVASRLERKRLLAGLERLRGDGRGGEG